MNDLVAWSLRGKEVIIADNAHFSRKFLPDAEHRLYVQKAFDKLSNDSTFSVPAKVTVDDIAWPIKAAVEPNYGRQVRWAAHIQHRDVLRVDQDKLCPFVYTDRDRRPLMTKSLTLELVGTNERPVLKDVYAGMILPPLPWELSLESDMSLIQTSVDFWRQHSYLYDIGIVTNKLHEDAPVWHTDRSSSYFALQTN
jgi:hypothetical protein